MRFFVSNRHFIHWLAPRERSIGKRKQASRRELTACAEPVLPVSAWINQADTGRHGVQSLHDDVEREAQVQR